MDVLQAELHRARERAGGADDDRGTGAPRADAAERARPVAADAAVGKPSRRRPRRCAPTRVPRALIRSPGGLAPRNRPARPAPRAGRAFGRDVDAFQTPSRRVFARVLGVLGRARLVPPGPAPPRHAAVVRLDVRRVAAEVRREQGGGLPVAPRSSRPDPLIANLHFRTSSSSPRSATTPRGRPPDQRDTALLLYALHEQAEVRAGSRARGRCSRRRTSSTGTWKALEACRDQAIALYCRTVEEDNPNWWNVLTEHLDDAEKREVQTAANARRSTFVAAGKLVAPMAPTAAVISPPRRRRRRSVAATSPSSRGARLARPTPPA